jgi:hypothetical protein
MKAWHRILLLSLLLAVAGSLSVQAQMGGSIWGQVLDGTKGDEPVANLEVTLTAYGPDGSQETSSARTDAEGSFDFGGLSISKGAVYQVTADYQGATYRSEALSFAAGQDQLSVEIVVYEATESDSTLSVELAHIVVEFASDGLAVTEMLLVRNKGNGTYIGSGPEVAAGKVATLRFPLPPSAELFNIGESLMRCCIVDTDDGFVDTMPVMPGRRAILYVYTMPFPEASPELRRSFAYPADKIEIFVSDEAEGTEIPGFSPAGTIEGQDSTYVRWTVSGLEAGEEVIVRLEGLPFQEKSGIARSAAARRKAGWLFVTAAVIPLALIVPTRRRWRERSERTEAETSADDTKDSLLQRVADLDDAFEVGEIPEPEYQVERAVLRQRLLVLWNQDAVAEQGSELSGRDSGKN